MSSFADFGVTHGTQCSHIELELRAGPGGAWPWAYWRDGSREIRGMPTRTVLSMYSVVLRVNIIDQTCDMSGQYHQSLVTGVKFVLYNYLRLPTVIQQ